MGNVANTALAYSPDESYNETKMPNLSIGLGTSFALTKEGAGENVIANTAQADGGVYSVRYAINDVKNVFAGSDIDPALYGAVKRGKNLLIKVRHTGTRMENGVAVHYPIECGITFKYPVNVVKTEDLLQIFEEALNATLEPQTVNGTVDIKSRLSKLMLGAFPRN